MRSDGPLVLAALFLAAGLTIIFAYGVGTAGFNAAYPFSGANIEMSITTAGPAAIGGLALTALGTLLLVWALICAIVGLFVPGGDGRRSERAELRRLDRQEKLEQKRLAQQDKVLEREERLRASYPKS